jgi:hypothetical protein
MDIGRIWLCRDVVLAEGAGADASDARRRLRRHRRSFGAAPCCRGRRDTPAMTLSSDSI